MSDSKKSDFNYHPIQLREIKVLKLSISDNSKFDKEIEKEDFPDFGFYHMHSDYDPETKVFAVRVRAVIGKDPDCMSKEESDLQSPISPFDLDVELVGFFQVDESGFDIKHIDSFAERNAPLIVYPYLREHVYSLTTRAGYDSALLPLFEVPAFRLSK